MPKFLTEPDTLKLMGLQLGPPWMLLFVIWLTVGADAPTEDSTPEPPLAARTFRVTDEWIEAARLSTGMSPRQVGAALNTLHALRFIRRRKDRVRAEIKSNRWVRSTLPSQERRA